MVKKLLVLGFILFVSAYPLLFIAIQTGNIYLIFIGCFIGIFGVIIALMGGLLYFLEKKRITKIENDWNVIVDLEEEKWRLNAKSVFIVIMDILNVREWEGLKKRGDRQSPSHLESILSFFVYIVEKEVGGSIDSFHKI